MTRSVGVHEAKTHLSKLLDEVAQGIEVEITNRGKVVAKLVPAPQRGKRQLGMFAGRVWIADNFDDPLEDEYYDLWEAPL